VALGLVTTLPATLAAQPRTGAPSLRAVAARALLAEAAALTSTLGDHETLALRVEIGGLQARAGDTAGAEQTLATIEPWNEREVLQSAIAIGEAEQGDLAAAVKRVREEMLTPSVVSRTLVGIVTAQFTAGDMNGARKTADALGETPSYEPRKALVGLFAERGDVKRAVELAVGFDREPSLSVPLVRAHAQAAAGDFDGAMKTVRAMPEGDRHATYCNVALHQFKARQTDSGIKTIALVSNERGRSTVLYPALMLAARRGEVTATRTILSAIKPLAKEPLDWIVVRAQVRAGDLAGARRTLDTLTAAQGKSVAVSVLALAQARAGDIAAARTTAASSAAARQLVAGVQAEAGDVTGAEQTIEDLPEREHAEGGWSIALGRARAGDARRMLARWATSPAPSRTNGLIRVAHDLLRERDFVIATGGAPFDGFTDY
jgi:hypothetical protein